MKPILSFLSDKKEHTVKEIDEHIAFVFNLSDEEKQQKLPQAVLFSINPAATGPEYTFQKQV